MTGDSGAPAPASVLDRLLRADPGRRPAEADTVARLQVALRRDIEALLNARRPWRSVPAHFPAARNSILSFGLPDFAGGVTSDPGQRERLRAEIARAIGHFEPRLAQVEVEFVGQPTSLDAVLAFRISALLLVDPVPEQIAFDTTVDTTTSDVDLRALQLD